MACVCNLVGWWPYSNRLMVQLSDGSWHKRHIRDVEMVEGMMWMISKGWLAGDNPTDG